MRNILKIIKAYYHFRQLKEMGLIKKKYTFHEIAKAFKQLEQIEKKGVEKNEKK